MELSCPNKNNIGIVGAGPAGIYCALSILNLFKQYNFTNYSIDIFDKNEPLRTILPTGNGRCNITNSISDIKEFASNYPRGEKFLYSIFSRYFTFETLDFFNSIGIKTYCEPDGRIFPISQSSKDVRDKMLKALYSYDNVRIIKKNINSKDDLNKYDKVVISAGSRGSENLIKMFNHSLVKFEKALCALNVSKNIYPKGVSVKSDDGDFVFTDKGISGPLAFKISSLNAYSSFPFELSIKLFDENKLFELVKKYPKKAIGTLVSFLIPKSLAKILVKDFYKNSCEISKECLFKLSFLNLKIISKAQFGEIVNAGGVELSELDKNCKSRIVDNLWFCGEILNIDGFCGGFNLQNCWSSSYIVANDLVSSIISINS